VSEKPYIAREALERYRDALWHRTPAARVTNDVSAARFIDEVACCLAFGGYSLGVPTLWMAACGEREPVYPEHSHHDPAVGLVWNAKESIPQAGLAYYGRLFLRKPSFVARAWLPTILAAYPPAILSPQGEAVVSVLRQAGPLSTDEVGLRTGITERKTLVNALNETQAALQVVKTEERYDPFTYVWGTFGELFAQDMAEAAEIPPAIARRKLVWRWLKSTGAVSSRRLASILGWPRTMVDEAVGPLLEAGSVVADVRLEGQPGTFLAEPQLCA